MLIIIMRSVSFVIRKRTDLGEIVRLFLNNLDSSMAKYAKSEKYSNVEFNRFSFSPFFPDHQI